MKTCTRVLLALSLLPLVHSFADQPSKEDQEEMRRTKIPRYMHRGFVRAKAEGDVILLKDLEAIIQKLPLIAPPNSDLPLLEGPGEKPRKAFQQAIHVGSDGDAKPWRGYIWLRLWSYDSFKEAEEGLANNRSMVNIALMPGSLTGREIGELSYQHTEHTRSANLMFLRGNVVVSTACRDLPRLDEACESLARDLDDLIIRLMTK